MSGQRSKHKDSERRGGVRPVAAALPKIAAKAIGKRGFAEAALITEWATIVGRDLALVSQPEKLAFPRGQRSNGTLHIRVAGGVATELQHLEPQVVARINGHFGYGAIARLKLTHAPLRQTPARPKRGIRKPNPKDHKALHDMLGDVEDDAMREALERLGTAIMSGDAEVKKS
tara:strand:+ start:1050 stop:1568 length:519 start_codon:yes stop_codon:yes gene_type:complete